MCKELRCEKHRSTAELAAIADADRRRGKKAKRLGPAKPTSSSKAPPTKTRTSSAPTVPAHPPAPAPPAPPAAPAVQAPARASVVFPVHAAVPALLGPAIVYADALRLQQQLIMGQPPEL